MTGFISLSAESQTQGLNQLSNIQLPQDGQNKNAMCSVSFWEGAVILHSENVVCVALSEYQGKLGIFSTRDPDRLEWLMKVENIRHAMLESTYSIHQS